MLINNYKHIIWDWNGTLLNDVDFCRKIINRILFENNLPELSLDQYREIFTFPVKNYYKSAGLDFSKTSFEVLGKDFMDEYEEKKLSCSLYENTADFLSYIQNMEIKQSILSAYKRESLIKIIDDYQLTQYFEYIVGADNIYASGKIDLGLQLIDQLKIPGNTILFIGDTLHDAEVALEMGVNSVLIANGHQSKNKLQINSNLVLNNLSELKEFLSF